MNKYKIKLKTGQIYSGMALSAEKLFESVLCTYEPFYNKEWSFEELKK